LNFASRFKEKLRALRHYEPFRYPEEAIPGDYRRAAVLIPFWREGDGVRVVMTRRAAHLTDHKGQVAFPGGCLDTGESWESAALREAHEEIGLKPTRVEVLGRLDDAWSGAGHHVVPIVGWVDRPPDLVANPREVAEILVADVQTLLLPETRSETAFEHEGVRYVNPVLCWTGGDAYGLTADLLLEALSWGEGVPAPGGPSRLRDLENYVRRRSDPVHPHGTHPVATQSRQGESS